MFNKILFPVDGSDDSNKALNYVIDIANKYNSQVIVLHVHEVTGASYSHSGNHKYFYFTDEQVSRLLENSNSLLKEAEDKLINENIAVKTRLEKGRAGPEIVKVIGEENCDLVIMGSRGLSSTSDFLLGNTSNHVIHHSESAVLLIH